MCSKGGGSPPVPNSASTSFQSTTTPAPFATPLYQDFLNRANTLSQTPFNPAMQGTVAPLNAEQTAAGGQLFQQGMDLGEWGKTLGNFEPGKVQDIMSPYVQNVVDTTQGWFNNQNAIQGNDLLSQAIKSGNAFGGDRAGVAEGVLAGQQQLAQAPVIAGLYQSGYTQALNEYNQLKQFDVMGRQMGMQGAQAALGWGGMEQAQSQREFDVAQQNAMMQSAYPFQTLNWYGAALGGVGPLLGAQTVGFNTPPEQSGAATALGIGSAAIGLGNAAFGGAAPAPAASSTFVPQAKHGGVIRRVRGGLVPVYIRHNGGIIPGLAYGGSSDDSDDDRQHEPSGLPEQAGEGRAQSEDYKPPQVGLPPREKAPSWGGQIGQLKGSSKQTTPSTFPGMGSSTAAPQKSEAEGWLNLATKAIPLATGLFALSDPRTKTDIQPAGKSEGGVPLWGFRYKGDPKSYPKVVGRMAKDPVRLADGGGDDDVSVMTDESPDPVSPGQKLAADYTGRTTWFNPRNERGGYTYTDDSGRNWTDTGAQSLREGPHASGLPSTVRGFATPGRSDLGNWFEVNLPGGRKTIAQKTDIGPPGVVDLNAPLASSVGYNPNNVGGRTFVRDLGRTRPPDTTGYGADESSGHEPGGLPIYSGNTGEKGSASTSDATSDEGAAAPRPGDDRAGPGGAGARPTPGAGTGQVGRQIPGLAKPAPTFAQRLANDPFWQFGTALMAKPGLKRYPFQGVGAAAQSMSAQQMHERNRILDEKPQMFDDGKQLHALAPDGTLTPTGLPSPKGIEARTKAPFAIESETPGPFGSSTKKKEYFTGYDENGNPIPFKSPTQQAQQPETPRITPPPEERPAQPQQAPAPPEQPASPPRQMRQTEAQPAEAPPPEARGKTGWSQRGDIIYGPDGATYDKTGKVLTPAPAAPAAAPGAAPGQQQQPPAQTGLAGPEQTMKRVEDQWAKGVIKPGGEITDPAALQRNDAALVDSQGRPLSPDEQRIIKGIADYKLDPNKVFAGKTANLRAPAIAKVMEYDPSYNQGQYAQRNATRKAYEATGVEARNIVAQDTAVQHADQAIRNIDALGHTRIPRVNKAIAEIGKETGLTGDAYQKAVTRINQDIHAVSNELMKVFRGGTGQPSEKEAKRIADTLNIYDNPEVLKEGLREGVKLLYGKVNATAGRYNDAMGPGYARPSESWFSPEGRAAVQRVLGQ